MTFRQWQRQARLLAALVKLAQREPVTTIALDLGYDSPSAFIHAFRQALGTTPRRYFERPGS
jgi:AraC-like DNA-binding protein